MAQLTTTDNKTEERQFDRSDYSNLEKIANRSIDKIIGKNPSLLVFPTKWQQGIEKQGKLPQICGLYKISEDKCNLSTGNVMGFVGVNNTALHITSRFYNDKDDIFLHYMLAKVFNINVVDLDLSKGNNKLYDFLPYLFPYLLNNALAQGLYKQYQRNQYNDANVKGTIDVNRHIRLNIPFAGKIAYNTREHSYDNNVTQLVRHTIETLRTRPFGHTVLNSSDDTRQNVAKITFATGSFKKSDLQKIIRNNQQTINHPYFTKYKDLQILCLQILRNEYTAFGNEKDKIHGILFDGAWLWEEYVAKVFEEHKLGIEHRTIETRPKEYLFRGDDKGDVQWIIPDFIRYKKQPETALFIGDTKYKRIEKDKREDYFQVLAYMYRYSCELGCLIYPEGVANEPEELIIANRSGSKVIKLGLTIPQGQEIKNFSQFVPKMKEAEGELIKTLSDYLKNL